MKYALGGIVVAALVAVAVAAPPEEKPAGSVDCFGDPLPDGALARFGTVRWRAGIAGCLAFSADGKRLVTNTHTALVWDIATGGEIVRAQSDQAVYVQHIALSPDGETIATHQLRPGGYHFWDARTGKHLRGTEPLSELLADGAPFTFAFSADGRTLFAGAPGSVSAVAVAEGKTVPLPAAPEKGLSLQAVSPDGATAVSAGDGGRLVVWDLRTGKTSAEVAGPKERGWVALAAGGKRLAVATSDVDEPTITVWDLETGKERCRCKGHFAEISSVVFAPDGKSLATGAYDITARLWDTETGKELWSYRGDRTNLSWVRVAFSPDGKTVGAAGWNRIIRLLDARTGKERPPVAGHLGSLCRGWSSRPTARRCSPQPTTITYASGTVPAARNPASSSQRRSIRTTPRPTGPLVRQAFTWWTCSRTANPC